MTKEEYIKDIEIKLAKGIKLDGNEIRTIVAALRESSHCYQEPYYEVTYYDKYGNKECRIMNPEYRAYKKEPISDDLFLMEDRFSVNFRRFIHAEDL